MRRRDFIKGIAASATAGPLAARAQPSTTPVIGYFTEAPNVPEIIAAFQRGLAEAGYIVGKNVAVEYRFANYKRELLPEAMADFTRLNVNVIVAAAPEAVVAAKRATTSIPIVALDLESDPVAKGYVKSLGRPGGNLTGIFLDFPELTGKQVGLLKGSFLGSLA